MKNQTLEFTLSLENFVSHLVLSRSEVTAEGYKSDVKNFLKFVELQKVRSVTKIKQKHIIDYLSATKASGRQDSTIVRRYHAIRSFMKWCKRQKLIVDDLLDGITIPKNDPKPPHIMTRAEVQRLIESPDTTDEVGTRDRAILELMYSSGLRASEVVNLHFEDFQGNQIMIERSKRKKSRTIPITEAASVWIGIYISQFRGDEEGPLFWNCCGSAINRHALWRIVNKYARKEKIKEVTPHVFRHSCATHLLESGADLRVIQELLGHKSITTTERYTQMTSAHMQKSFNSFHPRNKV